MCSSDLQRAAKLKEFEDLQKGIMEPYNMQRSITEKAITGGRESYKAAEEGKRKGLEGGYHVYGADVQSRDKALDREVDRLKVGVQAEANRIQKEGLSLNKAQTVYATALGRVQELERKLDMDFAKSHGMLLMAEQSGKMDDAQKAQLDTERKQIGRAHV